MREIIIGTGEAGQRLDKFLARYMNLAPKSFFYKMMRKKNITLNGKKCEGGEKLSEGDTVKLFLADETIEKFSEIKIQKIQKEKKVWLDVLYEDDDILLINKPAGMLSQKAKDTDISLVEYLTDYLLEKGSVTEASLRNVRPSVCNRLDRNTSGIVAAGKTLAGLQMLSEVFHDRTVHKFYQCIVHGEVREGRTVDGWLLKDDRTNQVRILKEADAAGEAKRIVTRYEPVASTKNATLLWVTLLTGRSHQIRAHLASMGHPVLGDLKYGNLKGQELEKKYRIRGQLLHSFRLEFPVLSGRFSRLSKRAFEAPLPEPFLKVMAGEGLQPGNGMKASGTGGPEKKDRRKGDARERRETWDGYLEDQGAQGIGLRGTDQPDQ